MLLDQYFLDLRFESNVKLGITYTKCTSVLLNREFESNVKLGITYTKIVISINTIHV